MFYKDKSRNGGLSYRCKDCSNFMSKNYREKNPDKIKECIAKWFKDHPYKNREAVKRYREKNLDILKERKRNIGLSIPKRTGKHQGDTERHRRVK